jgi:four helix bundle protein
MRAARHFTELLIWQIADELRVETLKLTSLPGIFRRYKFRDQVEDAADSICRNIAEGFAADTHGQFAAYLRVSKRSLDELKDAFRSVAEKQAAPAAMVAAASKLERRLRPPLNRLIDYLERTPKQRNRPDRRPPSDDDGFYYRVE